HCQSQHSPSHRHHISGLRAGAGDRGASVKFAGAFVASAQIRPTLASRRQFLRTVATSSLVLLGSACGVLPMMQSARRRPRIGYLSQGPREEYADQVDAFLGGLRDLGYNEGQTIDIEWRFTAETNDAPWRELADDLVRQSVDVILTGGLTPTVLAAKAATAS